METSIVYLEIAAILGWRATETASLKEDDILDDGFVRIAAKSSKTRKHKVGWLPEKIHTELCACRASGWAFGRFPEELRRLLTSLKGRPHHAARVNDFSPKRLVGWLQDELNRYHQVQAKIALASLTATAWQPFTLHDFRRTAITGLQMAGVSEKETSLMVGATPEVIRRHYERMDLRPVDSGRTYEPKRFKRLRKANYYRHEINFRGPKRQKLDPSAPIFAPVCASKLKSAIDCEPNLPETASA